MLFTFGAKEWVTLYETRNSGWGINVEINNTNLLNDWLPISSDEPVILLSFCSGLLHRCTIEECLILNSIVEENDEFRTILTIRTCQFDSSMRARMRLRRASTYEHAATTVSLFGSAIKCWLALLLMAVFVCLQLLQIIRRRGRGYHWRNQTRRDRHVS